jgi:hypothetical protein
VAAAKCCLLRPDLFGGTENRHWHKAKAVLQDFLTPSDAAASTECAVVPTLRGTAWPPAPTLQLNGFIHIPWTKAEVHLAPAGSGTTAGVHTAAGAGTAAASGKEGQADEERPAAAPAAAKKSCAPPGKAQTASAAPPQDKPKTSAGGQKGRAAAADQRGPDHHLTLLKLLATVRLLGVSLWGCGTCPVGASIETRSLRSPVQHAIVYCSMSSRLWYRAAALHPHACIHH